MGPGVGLILCVLTVRAGRSGGDTTVRWQHSPAPFQPTHHVCRAACPDRAPQPQREVRRAQLRLAQVYGSLYDTIRARGTPPDGMTDLWACLARVRHPATGGPNVDVGKDHVGLKAQGTGRAEHNVAIMLCTLPRAGACPACAGIGRDFHVFARARTPTLHLSTQASC